MLPMATAVYKAYKLMQLCPLPSLSQKSEIGQHANIDGIYCKSTMKKSARLGSSQAESSFTLAPWGQTRKPLDQWCEGGKE